MTANITPLPDDESLAKKVDEWANSPEGRKKIQEVADRIAAMNPQGPRPNMGPRITGIPIRQAGWICPNCERVYSPQHSECSPCNEGRQSWKSRMGITA